MSIVLQVATEELHLLKYMHYIMVIASYQGNNFQRTFKKSSI
jgi:hypothetical protein